MKFFKIKYSLLSILSFIIICNLYAINTDNIQTNFKIYLFEIHQEIGPSATRMALQAVKNAEEMNADYILLDLDTYGGLVDDADHIRTALINTKIPTMVFIRNNAASAGALISIACDSIYMKEGATIGAAAVVNEEGQLLPEKYQSYMRNKMRATAEATNRSPEIAEGMVDPKVEIKGITSKDEIITFSVKEAIDNNYCIAKVENVNELLIKASLQNHTITKYKKSSTESIISFFVNPAVASFLLMLIMGGIYFELQSPGIGFPIAAALIAAMLYFLPHYLEGLAANWEILLFTLGIILLVVEVFIIPGFGIAGVAGVFAVAVSLTLSLVRNIDGFDFSFVSKNEMAIAFLTVSAILIISIVSIFFGGESMMSKAFSNGNIGLNTILKTEENTLRKYIGKEGISMTDLNLSGKIKIDNEWLDAQSDGDFIDKNTSIRIIDTEGMTLIVESV